MTTKRENTEATAAAAPRLADRMRVEVSAPSTAEEDAAYDHLLRQDEASFNASALADEMKAEKNGDAKRADHLIRNLELVAMLRSAGNLTHEQYVFMAASPAIFEHEKRVMAGVYADDVREIEACLRAIEKEGGLQKDEYWPASEGPEEWQLLNRQWSAAVDAHLDGVLQEFGLNELADLRRSDVTVFEAAFEQGRKGVFHKEDHRNAVASLVHIYENEARKAELGNAPYAAIVMYGAACEARLLLMVLDHPLETSGALSHHPLPRRRADPMKWTLETLIVVANAAGWLKSIEHPDADMPLLEWAHSLRSVRNLLHPGRHALEHPHASVGETQVHSARSIYTMICTALANDATGTNATTQGYS